MKAKLLKNMRIINDLMIFCHSAGAVQYDIHYVPEIDEDFIGIRAQIPNMPEDMLNELKDALKLDRMREVEQNYWGLGGGDNDATYQLTLIGMMLDESSASYEDGVLTILAKRLK